MEPGSFAEVSPQAKQQVLGKGPSSIADSNLALS